MALQVGIIGLPLVGKTTVFNAVTAAGAESAAYSKASTKPNIGIARIPDQRLQTINQFIETDRIAPATIQVVDVAGLVRGASTGQGLGNKFLAHIRDMDAILHVVRCFDSDEVAHVEETIDPVRDIDTVETELILADLEQVATSLDKAERAARSGEKDALARAEILKKAYAHLNDGHPVRELSFTPEQKKAIKSMGMITAKKVLFVANVGENDPQGQGELVQKMRARCAAEGAPLVTVCGKLEAEIVELSEADRGEMLAAMGLNEPALALLAREAYKLLGLHSFFTAGPIEIKAWTIPIGANAPQAAGAIHSDFERGFIRAEIYSLDDLIQYKTEHEIKHHGKLRVEGKNYTMKDGDITHFLFNV
ncbi:MAG: redox-regulated ATPase YchF [Planctomycetota bacterium]|nr:redox-regulated ATPase YchF [Planctomycetota bacterium]